MQAFKTHATVLARLYRAEQLAQQQDSENVDMEDTRQQQGQETNETAHTHKKAHCVYSGKQKKKYPMGAVSQNGGAGGSGVLALCLLSH